MVPFRRVPPGGRPRARELARLQEYVAGQTNATGGSQAVGFGTHQVPRPPQWIWARLGDFIPSNQGTANGYPECGWYEYDQLNFNHCTGQTIDGVSMSAHKPPGEHPPRFPAYNLQGCTDIPPGVVVQLWRGNGDYWLFKKPFPCFESGSGGSGESGESGGSGESGISGFAVSGDDGITPECAVHCHIPRQLYLTISCPTNPAFVCRLPMPYVGNDRWATPPGSTCPPDTPFAPGAQAFLTCGSGCDSIVPRPPDSLCFGASLVTGLSGESCSVLSWVPCARSPFFFTMDGPLTGGFSDPCRCGTFPNFSALRFTITE